MNRRLFILFALFVIITSCNSSNTEKTAVDTTDTTNSIVAIDSPSTSVKKEVPNFREGDYEEVNVDAFNALLAKEKKALSPQEVMTKYYPAVIPKESTSFENIKIDKKIEGNNTIVTLTHDNQPHIVIQGHRLVMELTKEKGQWKVLSLKQQFKCWKRRGIVWGVDRCS